MAENRADLSWQVKREIRFQKWLSPPGIKVNNPESENNYKARVTRIIRTITLKEPDRIPVVLPIGFIFAQNAGTTYHELAYNYNKLGQAWKKLVRDFESDAYNGPGMLASGIVNELLDYRMMKWPGHDIPPNGMSYQFVEKEYMKDDEYDALLLDPLDFAIRYYTPRIYGTLISTKELEEGKKLRLDFANLEKVAT